MLRRKFLTSAGAGGALVGLSGCKLLDSAGRSGGAVQRGLASANSLTYRVQRALQGNRLAREYSPADITLPMHPNGSTDPGDAGYDVLRAGDFRDYRLVVKGLVAAPLSLSLAELQAMPARSQITRHDCVEGWSVIAKWTGTPLGRVLDLARPKPEARFVVFRCFDTIERSLSGAVKYYESIDMLDACHPQTILAYGNNDKPLSVPNGAPLRVRVERQLGYKMAKYVHTIVLADTLAGFGLGRGSYWADRGYDWYAGI